MDQADEESEEEVEISLNAMNGEQTDTTFQVNSNISIGKGWTILDTRSTHNFIKNSMIETLGVPMKRRAGRFVALPNGGKCPIDGFCKGMSMKVQGHQFQADCSTIYTLNGFHVVLAIRWLNSLGRVVWDGTTKTVKLQSNNTNIIWHGEAAARGYELAALNTIVPTRNQLEN